MPLLHGFFLTGLSLPFAVAASTGWDETIFTNRLCAPLTLAASGKRSDSRKNDRYTRRLHRQAGQHLENYCATSERPAHEKDTRHLFSTFLPTKSRALSKHFRPLE